jgi:hypothetical protein
MRVSSADMNHIFDARKLLNVAWRRRKDRPQKYFFIKSHPTEHKIRHPASRIVW